MSDDIVTDALAGAGAAVVAYGLYELFAEPRSERVIIDYEQVKIYACEECGAIFAPGYGPNNIFESADDDSEAHRDGECPACGAEGPDMEHVTTEYVERRRDHAGTDGSAEE